ncbi:MAG: hypothetical protein R3E84_14850 [Pseudomonadales bacterium]
MDLPAGDERLIEFPDIHGTAVAWLDGKPLASWANAFVPWRITIPRSDRSQQLVISIPSIDAGSKEGGTRPQWRTALVANQQLRRLRLSLAGRMASWRMGTPLVGIGQLPKISSARMYADIHLRPVLESGQGQLHVEIATGRRASRWQVEINGQQWEGVLSPDANGVFRAYTSLTIPEVAPWFPHTHGTPRCYDVEVSLDDDIVHRASIGFRTVIFDAEFGDLHVNGVPVFCRGACWLPTGASETGLERKLDQRLEQVKRAGFNMLRVIGTCGYERDDFYTACDRLGIMVWQDMPFANLHYPHDDAFLANVREEVTHQARRLSRHACVTVWCGSSDGEQQPSLLGLGRERREQPLFHAHIPDWLHTVCPEANYVTSAPAIGDLPIHIGRGVTSYFGVGAYRLPLDHRSIDAVRFATECLGFANIPDVASTRRFFGSDTPSTVDPEWKLGTPRDNGASWDFDDVRDFYTEQVFQSDPTSLRFSNPHRYFSLSRIVSGYAMERVLSRWRAPTSVCRGALLWMLHDWRKGAGWGLVDSMGCPKPAYHIVSQCTQPVQVLVTDEHLDGHNVHVLNERDTHLYAQLLVSIILADGRCSATRSVDVTLAPASAATYSVDALFDRFQDTTYTYRFGPQQIAAVAGTLLCNGSILSSQVAFAGTPILALPEDAKPEIHLERIGDDQVVRIRSDRLLQWVHIENDDAILEPNYAHLIPGMTHELVARRPPESKRPLKLKAFNQARSIQIAEPTS